jgi:hypothetical protein
MRILTLRMRRLFEADSAEFLEIPTPQLLIIRRGKTMKNYINGTR